MIDLSAVNNHHQLSSKIVSIQQHFTNLRALFAKVEKQSLLITPNQRTTTLIRRDFNQYQQSIHKPSWQQLQVMPYEALIKTLFNAQTGQPTHCLSQIQEYSLWLDCVQKSIKLPLNKHHHALTALAQEAWHIVNTWDLPIHQMKHHHSKDVVFFDECTKHFTRLLDRKQCITLSQAANWLRGQKTLQPCFVAKRLVFYGFDQVTPSMLSMIDRMEVMHEIIWAELTPSEASMKCHSYHSQEQELEAAIQWMTQTSQSSPNKRLIAVAPSLTTMRPTIEKIIHRQKQQHPDLNINVSGGEPLSSYHLIRHALLMIQFYGKKQIKASSLSILLRSPFLEGAFQELAQRSRFDESIREEHPLYLNIKLLCHRCQSFNLPSLSRMLSVVDKAVIDSMASPSRWIGQFKQWLGEMGWPGNRSLSSEEHQLHKALDTVLASLCELDRVHQQFDFTSMLTRLQHACQQHLFQPESPVGNCHILGALEAASITCDEVWVMDCSHLQWPKPAQPHPFLPIEWQKKFQTPHCSAEKEYQFSWQILSRLICNAQDAQFSYAKAIDDAEQVPSQLVERRCQQSFPEPPDFSPRSMPLPSVIETLVDQQITAVDGPSVCANTSLFKQQAECPFSAAANYRLMATDLPTSDPHFSPADTGIIIHDALQRFWTDYPSQSDLQSLSADQLTDVIHDAVKQSMRPMIRRIRINQGMQVTIAQYLEELMRNTLAHEAQRPAFKVVARESHFEAQVLTIQLRGIIDRIDQFPDGRYALIDYKTGRVSPNEWFNDRLTQPQMPLYACLHQWSFDAVLFVLIQPNQIKYSGLIGESANLPALESVVEWGAVKSTWQEKINTLAHEWLSGYAAVEPALVNTCQYCHLSLLCRIRHAD